VKIVGSSPCRFKPKTLKLAHVASPLNTQHQGERAKTGWLGIRIMCQTCLTVASVSYKNPTQGVGLEQSRPHHHCWGLWYLMPPSTIFQLYRGGQFY
jgi:hypothetical protein